jgi:hypothetical protein
LKRYKGAAKSQKSLTFQWLLGMALSQNPTPCGWIDAEPTLDLVEVAFFPPCERGPAGMA